MKILQADERIRLSLLIEKMEGNEDYSKKIGLENVSEFCGKKVKPEEMGHKRNNESKEVYFDERS